MIPGKSIPISTSKTPGHYYVRALTPGDAVAYHSVRLCALDEQPPAFGMTSDREPNLSETASRLAQNPFQFFLGVFDGEVLAGIVRLSFYSVLNKQHLAYLGGLYVLPSHRGLGCGRLLAAEVLRRAAAEPRIRRVNLSVVTGQEAAIRLYLALGFVIYGTERETFSNAGRFYDEYLMTLELASSR